MYRETGLVNSPPPSEQDDAALLRLPNLVRIFVLVEFQKFLVGVQGGLSLLQFIVAECADEPSAGGRFFDFGDGIENGERARIDTCPIKGGAEIFPLSEIVLIEADGVF